MCDNIEPEGYLMHCVLKHDILSVIFATTNVTHLHILVDTNVIIISDKS